MNKKIKKNIINNSTIENVFCNDLPTVPSKNIGKILVTGASGYIGGRLVNELINRGYKVKVMVRSEADHYKEEWPLAEVVEADALNYLSLRIALNNVDVAFYLIHSLLLGPKRFQEADVEAAENFRNAAEENKLKRIIYLGGLGDVNGPLSDHLFSRIRVSEELKKGKTPVTILRAAVIIGSGSASYEILHHIVKKVALIPIPDWLNNRCQPISIRDVIKYLIGCLETKESAGNAYDIGGNDILTYKEMIEKMGYVLNRNLTFVASAFRHIGVYSYFVSLLTPLPNTLIKCLLEGLQYEVVCKDDSISKLIPFDTLPFSEALIKALDREEMDNVSTRWSDAYPKDHNLTIKLYELSRKPMYTATYSIRTLKSKEVLFNSICKIGGGEGWYNTNWMWYLRGILDKLLLGVGINRGRKSATTLKINDVVDFWRVEDIKKNSRLLLRAEMKLPGKAWLEFNIENDASDVILSVTPYYDTDTTFGKIYWYIFLPFHHIIFKDLIKEIERNAS